MRSWHDLPPLNHDRLLNIIDERLVPSPVCAERSDGQEVCGGKRREYIRGRGER